ncbi:valine--tRNA ligase [Candidatus Azambacteria bacterium RIFCSPLOWO2_01_FULL_46_26]|uniref:valine--tRNA ligase n=1 Tax=Candidatus Azambacteria bacterium RIFCSPLOWO2_01_FULL_46_26 TaxID=1797299 RepID=A0A1F5C6E1_9BACT|nr:MAG: valine--tRNA ligase [Candidatus Azambacteria bacterium RIFCSPLOWO2_01_FULL_46_26]
MFSFEAQKRLVENRNSRQFKIGLKYDKIMLAMDKFDQPYNPKETEDKIYQFWEKSGYFNPDKLPKRHKKPFCVMMAPPNITGHIHVGHALENALNDLITRRKRMQGYKALFLPGKDHAGIAGQYVVDRELRKQGSSRFELGREKFLEKMWQWMKEYGDSIDNELKKIGISCDWSRKRFTMDEDYQEAVRAAFDYYQKKGWIYKGKRMINWCSSCQTSISDLEVEYLEEKGKLWFIKYPLSNSPEFITVATTRPETMLGDAAVAVNPKDERYKNLIGKKAILPIQNREIPIVADDLVDKEFGTGAVKVTPAHDAVDFEIGQKHNLPSYEIIDKRGKMTRESKVCEGLTVKECREKVVSALREQNFLLKEEDYSHNVGVCERSKTVIEPMVSDQWFLSMKDLAAQAIRAARKNQIKFIPASRKQIFINWFKQVKDWNISRQLWWGHKVPVEGEGEVLDTWFSSALWPLATLGWPKKTRDLTTFFPTDIILSAREIFFLWIGRMVFSAMELTGKVPFKVIYTHATVLDSKGRKMSKSLGNTVDPLTLIDKYGADAVRFGLVWQVTGHQDVHWSEDPLIAGKKFCNKLWNASRFVLQQIGIPNSQFPISNKISNFKKLTKADKIILRELRKTIKEVDKNIEKFQFGQALQALYDFFWHEFCDVYLEASKAQLTDPKRKEQTRRILLHVLANSLKLLHPFTPFITEEIYSHLPIKDKTMLIVENWPK